LLQFSILGCYYFILRESVYWLRCDKLIVRKKHTFAAVTVANACSKSAFLAANASFCASWYASQATTGKTR
jgi:hypothetical protein